MLQFWSIQLEKNVIYGAESSTNYSLISHTTSSASTHSHLDLVILLDLYHITQHQSSSASAEAKSSFR